MFFAQAIEEARGLDAFLAREGRVKGPLHGLPVSVKDGFDVEGFDSTLGWVSLIGKPAEKDATLVGILRGLGAVVFCECSLLLSGCGGREGGPWDAAVHVVVWLMLFICRQDQYPAVFDGKSCLSSPHLPLAARRHFHLRPVWRRVSHC